MQKFLDSVIMGLIVIIMFYTWKTAQWCEQRDYYFSNVSQCEKIAPELKARFAREELAK